MDEFRPSSFWDYSGAVMRHHVPFYRDLLGRIGAPVFAATLVGCILQEKSEPKHWVLMAAGFALIVASHRWEHHGPVAEPNKD